MYMRPYAILTAAHYVPKVVGGRLGFTSRIESDGRLAEQVIRHPTIDLAALVVSKDAAKPPNGVYSEISHGSVDSGDSIGFG